MCWTHSTSELWLNISIFKSLGDSLHNTLAKHTLQNEVGSRFHIAHIYTQPKQSLLHHEESKNCKTTLEDEKKLKVYSGPHFLSKTSPNLLPIIHRFSSSKTSNGSPCIQTQNTTCARSTSLIVRIGSHSCKIMREPLNFQGP